MYGVKISAGKPSKHPKDEFPIKPPVVKFVHKVALSCVDSKGFVDVNKVRSQKPTRSMGARVGSNFSNSTIVEAECVNGNGFGDPACLEVHIC